MMLLTEEEHAAIIIQHIPCAITLAIDDITTDLTHDSVCIIDSSIYNPSASTLPDAHFRCTDEIAGDKATSFDLPFNCRLGPSPFLPSDDHDHYCCRTPTAVAPSATLDLHPRSLTVTAATCPEDEMTSFSTEVPGSPPGLSGSKSSKSSSNHSSSLSGTDGILSDITHFEDIGLDEDHFFPPPSYGMDKLSRLSPHTLATTASGHRNNSVTMTSRREMAHAGQKSSHTGRAPPSIARPTIQSLSLPKEAGGFMRRGYRNASTPSLAITAMNNCNRSRSPSPHPTSPLGKPLPSPRAHRRPGLAPVNVNHPPLRRKPGQPKRKTVKELEAEYNDSDEDLPDDASLWNVPLSPRPATERSPISAAASPRPSPRVSPDRSSVDRPSPLRTYLTISSPQTLKTASAIRPGSAISPTVGSPPMSPRKLLRGASTGMMPDHVGFGRSKSWNVALAELSEEAKALTESLENHAITVERAQEEAVQNGTASQQALEKLSRSKTSSVELPPLRLNNVMIDPLPISKEKEAVLSRTRPSWLPPKPKKEEQKHLKEYQRMMERHRQAEMRKAAAQADDKCVKDDTKSALLRIWEEHVLPNWDQVIREPRTRELWWRGVAPKSRGKVWEKAIGNELALTEVSFQRALQRAKDIEARITTGRDENRRERTWFSAIRRDVKVTFPELSVFQPGGPLHDGLVDVLMAYSMYRSDVGYSHGTHLISALLLLTLPNPTSAFIVLSNLLNRPLPLAFLTGDPVATQRAYALTLHYLAIKNPQLHAHLFGPSHSDPPTVAPHDGDISPTTPNSLSLSPHLVLEPMMRTLFLGPAGGVHIDIAARIWDVMVFDGDKAIIRTAVAVLGSLEGKLYGDRQSVLDVVGWNGGGWADSLGDEDAFMARLRGAGREGKPRGK